MTAAATPPVQSCPFCDRSGLPILPLRYAVARTDLGGKAPDIVTPFDACAVSLPGESAKYTLRILRPGYLYVFDEVRGEWAAYVVNEQGLLYHFDIHAKTSPQVPVKTFNDACVRKADPYLARCITVKDPAQAGKIWLAFSDVMWTENVLAAHAQAEYRKRHMRCIDMADVRAHKAVAHLDTLSHLRNVAEFTKVLKPDAHATQAHDELVKQVAALEQQLKQMAHPSSGAAAKAAQNQATQARAQLAELKARLSATWLPEVTVASDRALGYSQQPLNFLGDQASGLMEWGKQVAKPYEAVMVGVPDPAGLAAELALLMRTRMQAFMNDERHDKDRPRKTALSGVIEQIRDAIRMQAEQDFIDERESRAQRDENGYMMPGGMLGGVPIPGNAALAASDRAITADELRQAGDDEWKKYDHLYWETQRTAWQNDFNTALQSFDQSVIGPLAIAHRDLLKGEGFYRYFDCNFDPAVVASGIVYTTVFGQCIAGTQDKRCSADLYNQWLQGDLTDKRNILLRALCLHQDAQAKAIQSAAQSSVTWAELPWDKLMSIGKTTFDQLLEAQKDEVGRLASLVAGAITATLKLVGENKRIYAGLVALGVAARKPFVLVTVEGGKKAFRASLIKNMLKLSGKAKSIPKNKMEKAVADELRRQEICGVDTEGRDKKTWLLMLDPDEVSKMPKNLGVDDQAKWLAKTIRTPEQVDELNLADYRESVVRGSERIKVNLPFTFAVLALLANGWAMHSIMQGEESALAVHQNEMRRRVYTQGLAIFGAVADAIEGGLTRLSITGVRLGQAAMKAGAKIFSMVGRIVGVAAGIMMAAWDGWRAYEEHKAGHNGAAAAYAVSGLLGAAATVLLFIGWTGWGLLVVGFMVAWAFVMALLVNNKIQDWLELTYWGRAKNAQLKYKTSEMEMQQLDVAIKG
ncbi:MULTISPECIES: T6SS effector BTH_I2691 family protein [unclassified Paraburkholderia]|uniref:T6SS effector BTH_I2691 family protein n=1 Tax=unclassified Paraburkholderia TaxID=2615204 RepID=UPI002AB0AD21|nr:MULTISPECIES: T6SS effector BTH_I2691 family protein [unclassified Paraburkholderia]